LFLAKKATERTLEYLGMGITTIKRLIKGSTVRNGKVPDLFVVWGGGGSTLKYSYVCR
jgi:hypothetical protein